MADLEHYVAELALLPTAYPLPGHGNTEMECLKVELRRLDPGAGLPTPTPEPGTVQLPLEPDITDPTKGHHALFSRVEILTLKRSGS